MGKQARLERDAQASYDKAVRFWGDYFCGCGDSESALQAFREIMELFVEPEGKWKSIHLDFDKRQAYEAKHGSGLTYLILYWLTGMGLIEHGGSVGGSWMTPLGQLIRMEVLTSDDPFS